MKKYQRLLIHSVVVGLITGLVVFVCDVFSVKTWVVFFAWANYFLHGCDFKKSLKMVLALSIGVFLAFLASIIITNLNADVTGLQKTLVSSGVIFVVATVLVFLEFIENWGEMVPATFLGTVLFFASGVTFLDIIPNLLFPLIIGVVVGLLTILARKYLDACIK